MTNLNHSPYWPSVTIVREGQQLIYNWNELRWEPITSAIELDHKPDVEPGTDWTTEQSL